MKRCTNCKSLMPDDAARCIRCGFHTKSDTATSKGPKFGDLLSADWNGLSWTAGQHKELTDAGQKYARLHPYSAEWKDGTLVLDEQEPSFVSGVQWTTARDGTSGAELAEVSSGRVNFSGGGKYRVAADKMLPLTAVVKDDQDAALISLEGRYPASAPAQLGEIAVRIHPEARKVPQLAAFLIIATYSFIKIDELRRKTASALEELNKHQSWDDVGNALQSLGDGLKDLDL